MIDYKERSYLSPSIKLQSIIRSPRNNSWVDPRLCNHRKTHRKIKGTKQQRAFWGNGVWASQTGGKTEASPKAAAKSKMLHRLPCQQRTGKREQDHADISRMSVAVTLEFMPPTFLFRAYGVLNHLFLCAQDLIPSDSHLGILATVNYNQGVVGAERKGHPCVPFFLYSLNLIRKV